MAGFLMLSREIQAHWIFDDPEKLKAWLVILLEVNYTPKKSLIKGEIFNCEVGESLYSLDTWATKFGKGWNKSSVRRFFDLLKKDEMITLKSETVTTRLTVCNYLKYNKPCNADETQMKRERNADDTGATPTKEMNKVKKENKESKHSRFTPPTIEEVKAYCLERGNKIDPQYFVDSNTGKGWKVGKTQTPMQDWKAVIRTWEGNEKKKTPQQPTPGLYPRNTGTIETLKKHGVYDGPN